MRTCRVIAAFVLFAAAAIFRGLAAADEKLQNDNPVKVRYGWSEPRDCTKEAAVTGMTPDSQRPIVRGHIDHHGLEPIRNVQVCVAGACASVAGGAVIAAGESKSFELRVKNREAAKAKPTLRCSILEPHAGA